MLKLVALSEGYTGCSHSLTVERTTVGRVEDNAFTIPEPSVSSHHCEILLKGNEVVVRDLDSTNGTFINDERITEGVLKPGQILRLGQLELRLESGDAPTAAPGKKAPDQTLVVPQGVRFGDNPVAAAPVSDTATQLFKKKSQAPNRAIWFVVGAVVVAVLAIIIFTLITKL
jgi:predicted component of type VI protein secretion system